MKRLSAFLLAFFTVFAVAATKIAPLGNPNAPKGGSIIIGLASYPKSLLYYLATDEMSLAINSLILEPLLESSPETNEMIPRLASEWSVSKDKKTFTFKLNPAAKFSDGKPVTSEDVKFTWDTLMNPKNKTVPFQSVFASFESCTVVDPQTIQFKARTLHFKNLDKLAELFVLPKHFYSKGDFNKAFHTEILGSGPYTLEALSQGERVGLKRAPGYWGTSLPQNIGRYNFDKVVFKAVADFDVEYELFKKGDIDYFYFLSSKMWATETDGPPYQKNYIKKLKAESRIAYGMQGMVWNLRKPLFQDRRVRMALSHLINIDRFIKELFYNNYVASAGIVNINSEYHSPKNKPIPYDPKKARELLKEAGWEKVGTDGVLVKDGQRFEFEMLIDNPTYQRYLTIYQEDLKKMGIKMNIRVVDWATSIKLRDDWQFDATQVARSQDIDPSDFATLWGSKDADIKGSNNNSGYKNPEVDKLAQQIDETFDKKARVPMVRKLDEIITHDQPMTFTYEATFIRLAYWNRYSFPGKGYFKYQYWRDAFQYWWFDEAKEAKLKQAMAKGEPVT